MALLADGRDTDRGSSCTELESVEVVSVLYIYWSERLTMLDCACTWHGCHIHDSEGTIEAVCRTCMAADSSSHVLICAPSLRR